MLEKVTIPPDSANSVNHGMVMIYVNQSADLKELNKIKSVKGAAVSIYQTKWNKVTCIWNTVEFRKKTIEPIGLLRWNARYTFNTS